MRQQRLKPQRRRALKHPRLNPVKQQRLKLRLLSGFALSGRGRSLQLTDCNMPQGNSSPYVQRAADEVVHNVTSVMLMSIYLEEGNYTRAESLLEETFRARATQKDRSIRTYFALAGQAVNGARAHIARYRNFGINVTDAELPAEALADLDRLRSLIERMIAQAREISKDDSKAYDSLALLEDVLGIRLSLAREGEDEREMGQ